MIWLILVVIGFLVATVFAARAGKHMLGMWLCGVVFGAALLFEILWAVAR